jgi:hypothetical protein
LLQALWFACQLVVPCMQPLPWSLQIQAVAMRFSMWVLEATRLFVLIGEHRVWFLLARFSA